MPKQGKKEEEFQKWYKAHADRWGLNPDPDVKEHYYDYRKAYEAGEGPDRSGHWPSRYKKEGHPRLFINGRDTRE